MTKTITVLLLLGLSTLSFGQTSNGITKERLSQLETLVDLIKHDRIQELADRAKFPIKRPNPIPDLKTKEQFILYYPVLFDSIFKEKLTTATFNDSNTIDRYNGFGLFRGDIWLSDDGGIMTINYNSPQELDLQRKLHLETEHKIHPSIADWEKNVLVCQTDRYLIRIDIMDNSELRYISWNKPKQITDEPDLVLFDGEEKFQGSMGGVTYTFENGKWTYEIDRVAMAESDEKLGLYLRVSRKNKVKMIFKTEEIN